MKKFSMMSLAMVSLTAATLATTGATAFAVDPATPANSKTSTASVGFKTPDKDALTLTKVADLDFGNHPISEADETYINKTTPNNMTQVKDIRGTGAGWIVQLTQTTQLKNGTSKLIGAQIKFKGIADNGTTATDTTALIPGIATTVWTAASGKGYGVSNLTPDNTSTTLEIPQNSNEKAATYTADLKWDLVDAVKNS